MDVFCEIPCLTDQSKLYNGIALQRKWFKSADKRIIGQFLQKFIVYNSENLNFLGVQPYILGIDQNVSLTFRTKEFIGCIPLRAPDTGKQIGDFVVIPRFNGYNRFEDYIEIINLLGTEINPLIIDSIPLASGNNFRPPFYLEAIKFINSLENLLQKQWRKFDNTEVLSPQPIGQINWKKYINSNFKVENRLKYPLKKNILNEFHKEYSEIRHVFDKCKIELLSSKTPPRIKHNFQNRVKYIEEKLYFHMPKSSIKIEVHSYDNPIVKNCKMQANKILSFDLINSTAWRVDISDVFEKFIQYLFKEISRTIGGKIYPNLKFSNNSQKTYNWELKHVEPDLIYKKEKLLVFIDAKYKSNFYNKRENSDYLKEDHRHDLHQIMAYTSFSETKIKFGILCYPYNKLEMKKLSYENGINKIKTIIYVVGIPLKVEEILDSKKLLIEVLDQISIINLADI